MADPSATTITTTVVAGAGLGALMPGIDGNALIGAFGGATLFVVSAKDLPVWRRFVYLAISAVIGYLGAPELMRFGVQASGVAAFIAAAMGVTVTLALIEQGKSLDIAAIWRGARKKGPDDA